MSLKKKIILGITSVTFVIIILFVVPIIYQTNQIRSNEGKLKNKILSYQENLNGIYLRDTTPFEWDKVYFFGGYASPETLYEVTGYNWLIGGIGTSEGVMQVVFMKGSKVVCYCFGFPSAHGYYLNYNIPRDERYKVFYAKDDPKVNIVKERYVSVEVID